MEVIDDGRDIRLKRKHQPFKTEWVRLPAIWIDRLEQSNRYLLVLLAIFDVIRQLILELVEVGQFRAPEDFAALSQFRSTVETCAYIDKGNASISRR